MNTIILVHGFMDSEHRMAYMATYLRRRGWNVLTPTLQPSNGAVPLEELAAQLKSFISKKISSDKQVDLVGYSMGGLICRYYLQRLGGLLKTDRFISISTPHKGTITAHLFSGPGIRQMRPGSPFLRDLDNDADRLKEIVSTVLYTPMDLTIIPAKSSVVSFAHVIRFPVPDHMLMVYYPPVLKMINQLLSTPIEKTKFAGIFT